MIPNKYDRIGHYLFFKKDIHERTLSLVLTYRITDSIIYSNITNRSIYISIYMHLYNMFQNDTKKI